MKLILLLVGFVAMATCELVHMEQGRYQLSYWQAYDMCDRAGMSLASPKELQEHQENGYSKCTCGWLSDRTAAYAVSEGDSAACGVDAGVHVCDWRNTYDAYCIGYPSMPNCTSPFGVETGEMRDNQFSTSSVNKAWWGPKWLPHKAKLNNGDLVNAWMPNWDDRSQYLQIDFDDDMTITGIMTQGAKRYTKQQYVTQYQLKYTRNLVDWFIYNDGQVFEANEDNDSHVRNWLNPPLQARAIQIRPHEWYGHITLRIELYGCTVEDYDLTEEFIRLNKN